MLGHVTSIGGAHSRRTALGLALTAVVTMATTSGCGLLGGSDNSSSRTGAVEKSKINVAIIATADLAPFHLANKNGYFKQEGLDVAFTTNPSSPAALQKVIAGEADVAFGSYVPFFVAQSKGAADIKFVADSVSASPRSNVIVAKPGGPVQNVRDLAGRRIGV